MGHFRSPIQPFEPFSESSLKDRKKSLQADFRGPIFHVESYQAVWIFKARKLVHIFYSTKREKTEPYPGRPFRPPGHFGKVDRFRAMIVIVSSWTDLYSIQRQLHFQPTTLKFSRLR
jgi:hypothetical protein